MSEPINLTLGMKNRIWEIHIIFIEKDMKCWIPSLLWAEIDSENISIQQICLPF